MADFPWWGWIFVALAVIGFALACCKAWENGNG
jgi:hypothetical protein